MKKTFKAFISGAVVSAIVFNQFAAFAETATKTLQAAFNDIQILINGTRFTPKDPNGNIVEPFIVDGTTYLPVRAVSEALGKTVTWDGAAKTVSISDTAPQNQPEETAGPPGAETLAYPAPFAACDEYVYTGFTKTTDTISFQISSRPIPRRILFT